MGVLKRVAGEPLVHFVLIGAALFGLYGLLNPPAATADREDAIVVSPALVGELAQRHAAVWQRAPSVEELDGLIDSHVRQEVLVREAEALDLGAGDSVVRQRLAQKMAFLNDAAATPPEPSDEDLETFRAAHAERYQEPARIAFAQVYLGDNADDEAVRDARERLDGGEDPAGVGVKSLLPASVPLASEAQVDGTFGRGMFAALTDLPEGAWAGPVRSSFGVHLVEVGEVAPAREPPLAEIREQVLRDWTQAQTTAAAEARLAQMVAAYDVRRPTRDELAAMLP